MQVGISAIESKMAMTPAAGAAPWL